MKTKTLAKEYLVSVGGGVLYALAYNLIVLPFGLFSGTLAGVAQIIQVVLVDFLHLPIPASFNLMGAILILMNLPLMIIAFSAISRVFFFKSILTIVVQSLALSIIPVPTEPLIDNVLTASIVGGLIAGFGAGITLRAGGSAGGTDILGILITKKSPDFSVGKITLLIGAVVFSYCLWQYDFNIVVYSAIFTVFYAFTIDRTHHQTIKTNVFLVTRKQEVTHYITHTLGRGATCWKGVSPYTGEETYVCMSVLSKYEAGSMRRSIKAMDPKAFVIFNDKTDVVGNFERRL